MPAVLYSPFIHFSLSIIRLLFILPLYPSITHPYKTFVPSEPLTANSPTETRDVNHATTSTSLLIPRDIPFQSSSGLLAPKPQYGTFNGAPSADISRSQSPLQFESGAPPKPNNREINLDPTWSEMGQRIRRLSPYLWPKGNRKLELLAAFCLLLLVVGRFVNFLVPWTLKKLVSVFEHQNRLPRPSPWLLLLGYALLRFLQGSGGINALRDVSSSLLASYCSLTSAPIDRMGSSYAVLRPTYVHDNLSHEQPLTYPFVEMSQMSFDHLLNLSLAFHTRRKTGEILRVLDKGQSINRFVFLFFFSMCMHLKGLTGFHVIGFLRYVIHMD